MKTVSLMILLIIVPNLSLADFPTIKITNFDVSYDNPSGSGTADEFQTPDEYVTQKNKMQDKRFEISFSKEENKFIFTYGSNEFVLESPPDMLMTAETFEWSDLNLQSLSSNINLTLGSLDYSAPTESGLMRSLSIKCTENVNSEASTGDEDNEELSVKLLDSCLKTSKITLAQYTSHAQGIVEKVINQSIFDQEPTETTKIKNLTLSVSNHSFALKVTAKVDITVTVKARGKVWYLKDENKIKIRLDKAKVGFFSIKGKVFSELEKDTSGKITVQRPFIYLDLND